MSVDDPPVQTYVRGFPLNPESVVLESLIPSNGFVIAQYHPITSSVVQVWLMPDEVCALQVYNHEASRLEKTCRAVRRKNAKAGIRYLAPEFGTGMLLAMRSYKPSLVVTRDNRTTTPALLHGHRQSGDKRKRARGEEEEGDGEASDI